MLRNRKIYHHTSSLIISHLTGLVLMGSAGLTFAASPSVNCEVKNAEGTILKPLNVSMTLAMGDVDLLAEGEQYSYSVKFKGETAVIAFIDKRSGDRVVVSEDGFAKDETASVQLVGNEEPNAALQLLCTAF